MKKIGSISLYSYLSGIVCLFVIFTIFTNTFLLAKNSRLSTQDSTSNIRGLQLQIDALLADKSLQKSKFGVSIYSLDSRKNYYAKNAGALLIPASTTKLFSTFSAMYKLGGNANIATQIFSDAPSPQNGVLNGNIYLYGGGDPLFSIADIDALVNQLKKLGIKKINGSVYADASYFDQVMNRQQYSGDADEVEPLAPISALTLCHSAGRNVVQVVVTCNSAGKISAQTIPASDAFVISNQATVGSRKRGWKISISQSAGTNGKQIFTVRGTLSPKKSATYGFNIQNPAFVCAGVLHKRLEAGGINVRGTSGNQFKPANAQLLTAVYRPLKDIITFINKNSDNFAAEHIFKCIGAFCGDHKTTAKTSVSAIKTTMDEKSIPCQNCSFNDGSGLSRRNVVSADAEARLLAEAAETQFAAEFKNSFPIAGKDGTLRKRMKKTPAEGNLCAKTGTHKNVSALAGYVTTHDGERLVFSFIFNGNAVHQYKQIENKIGELLAGFSFHSSLSVR